MLLQYASSNLCAHKENCIISIIIYFLFCCCCCCCWHYSHQMPNVKCKWKRQVVTTTTYGCGAPYVLTRKIHGPDLLRSLGLHVVQQVCKMVCSIRLSTRSMAIRMWTMHTNSRRPIQLSYYSTFPCKYQSNKSHNRHLFACVPACGRKKDINRTDLPLVISARLYVFGA